MLLSNTTLGFVVIYKCKIIFINFTYHIIKDPCTKLNYNNQDHKVISRFERKPKVKFHLSTIKSVC